MPTKSMLTAIIMATSSYNSNSSRLQHSSINPMDMSKTKMAARLRSPNNSGFAHRVLKHSRPRPKTLERLSISCSRILCTTLVNSCT